MKKVFSILILMSLISPIIALAEVIVIDPPTTATSFEMIVDNLINFIFKIAIVLAPLMIIIGGALFLTAAGSVSQIDRAKKIIIWTAVGFAIVLLAKGLMAMIESILGI